ncbi:hypothetical protein [Streptomyces mirabilis]
MAAVRVGQAENVVPLIGYRAAGADVAATSALHALGQSHVLGGDHAAS